MPDTVQLPSLVQQLVAALARKGLTAAAAALVTWGLLPEGQSGEFVTIGAGLALGAVSIGWTWVEKQRARARLAQAVAAPPAVAITSAGDVLASPAYKAPR